LKSGYHSDVGKNKNFCNEIYESCEVTLLWATVATVFEHHHASCTSMSCCMLSSKILNIHTGAQVFLCWL